MSGFIDGAEYDDCSMFYSDETARATAEAVALSYRRKINELEAQLLLYRKALIENGVEVPDRSSDDLMELMRRIAALTEASTDFVDFFGSGKEMWSGTSWTEHNP